MSALLSSVLPREACHSLACAACDAILQELERARLPNVFNPWRDVDPLDALGARAPIERRVRLRRHFAVEAAFLLVGEAPGYQGCHFSGIPFTSEALLCEGAIPRCATTGRLSARERPWSEPSARIVWTMLYELGLAERTVMWNTFAFHPHRAGDPYTNRRPTTQEIDASASILRAVVDHFRSGGAQVVAVGRVAEKTLSRLGIRFSAQVQHPSYGGAPKFRAGLAALAHARGLPQCSSS